jgi:hypothetical protein
VIIRISSAGASEVETVVRVDLSTRAVGQAPIIEADHAPSGAPAEKIRAF